MQDKCIEGIIFVLSTEMEEKFSTCIYKDDKRINTILTKRNVFPICNLYYIYLSDDKYSNTYVKCFVWGCKVFGLRWEGRREGEDM